MNKEGTPTAFAFVQQQNNLSLLYVVVVTVNNLAHSSTSIGPNGCPNAPATCSQRNKGALPALCTAANCYYEYE